MWSFIQVYIQLGFQHITDPEGYDHMLFLLALVAPYLWFNKKTLVLLVTAFTLGHSLTLALAVLDIFRMNTELVETLIPITIILTALANVVGMTQTKWRHPAIKYILTTCFGLIHGLGFSTFFREMITGDMELVSALFCFNIGLELGQLLILCAIVLLSYTIHKFSRMQPKWFNAMYSGLAILLAIHLLLG
jgi:hypothetical protein